MNKKRRIGKEKVVILPKQNYFTLESVAKELDKDVDYVLEQFELGWLIPSVRLPELTGVWWWSTTHPIWVDEYSGWDWDGQVEMEMESVKESLAERIRERIRERRIQRQGYVKHVGAGVWFLPGYMYGRIHHDEDGSRYLLPHECFLSKSRIPPTRWFNPTDSVEIRYHKIRVLDLLVSKVEMERFYVTENMPARGEARRQYEKDNLLRTIGALIRLYVAGKAKNKAGLYGTPDNVNKTRVIKILHRHLELSGCDMRGLATSTLQKRFAKALDAVMKGKPSN